MSTMSKLEQLIREKKIKHEQFIDDIQQEVHLKNQKWLQKKVKFDQE